MLILFLLLPLQLWVAATQPCPESHLSEQQLLALSPSCFKQKYSFEKYDGRRLSRMVEQRITEYKKILQHIKLHKAQAQRTTPVVKWAQSKDKLFLNIKLSHRQDSPPCSDIRFDNFNFTNIEHIQGQIKMRKNQVLEETNSSSFSFEGFCYFTNQKLLFVLQLTFNSTLTNLTVEKDGLGSYTLVGDKAISQIWIDPFPNVTKSSIWAELMNKYEKDMEEYFQMREARLEAKGNRKKPAKRRRKEGVNKQSNEKQVNKNEQL